MIRTKRLFKGNGSGKRANDGDYSSISTMLYHTVVIDFSATSLVAEKGNVTSLVAETSIITV